MELRSHLHLGNSLVPSADDLSFAHGKLEGLSTSPWGIENSSVLQRARVVHNGGLASLGEGNSWKSREYVVRRSIRRRLDKLAHAESFEPAAIFYQLWTFHYFFCMFHLLFMSLPSPPDICWTSTPILSAAIQLFTSHKKKRPEFNIVTSSGPKWSNSKLNERNGCNWTKVLKRQFRRLFSCNEWL